MNNSIKTDDVIFNFFKQIVDEKDDTKCLELGKNWIHAMETNLASMETNLNGAYRVAKSFTDLLLEQKKPGSVINIASILGLRVGLNLTSYAAAKAGLVQLTKSMALELARSGIRVNAIAPGYILTEINDDFFKTEDGQSYIKSIPMNRLGLESELDGLLLLLASDASSFMTGSIIPVDGGHLVNPL